jgi:hypothetical protein
MTRTNTYAGGSPVSTPAPPERARSVSEAPDPEQRAVSPVSARQRAQRLRRQREAEARQLDVHRKHYTDTCDA